MKDGHSQILCGDEREREKEADREKNRRETKEMDVCMCLFSNEQERENEKEQKNLHTWHIHKKRRANARMMMDVNLSCPLIHWFAWSNRLSHRWTVHRLYLEEAECCDPRSTDGVDLRSVWNVVRNSMSFSRLRRRISEMAFGFVGLATKI